MQHRKCLKTQSNSISLQCLARDFWRSLLEKVTLATRWLGVRRDQQAKEEEYRE
jgi:hypothetical protein